MTQGSIRVDGVDIRQMSQKELTPAGSRTFPRRAMLFTGTIAENLRYGKPDATDGEVRPRRGVGASGGVYRAVGRRVRRLDRSRGYQLLWRAKAAADHRPGAGPPAKIYIFDDNFSALDFKTDAKVRMALQRETKDATVIIVTQE